jgi:hypothetical protein
MSNKLWDLTYWDGSRLIATAENIVAPDGQQAVRNGLRAIGHRSRTPHNGRQLVALAQHMDYPKTYPAPDGLRAFAAEKPRGVKVIG